ncbi:MAG TPA: class I tRNA ligase family protein, partial [Gammaproteobacteria bacterium]|nr:class I tRNA ligase family protein [Gammaproteobacteria bacterium]
WFQSSLLTSMAIYRQAPYRTVLTHGFTVDAEGRKMSKSLGNVISPSKVVNQLGADVVRLWVSATDYKGEITVSNEIFNRTSDAYRRIRNTARFLLSNLNGFLPEHHVVEPQNLLALDAWAVDRAKKHQEEIIKAYDNFQFHVIYQKIHNFCNVDLGGFYLDIIKDRQYTTKANSVARRSAQTAMYHIVQALCRWMAPILSFTAEEIWGYLPGHKAESVFLSTWYEQLEGFSKDSVMNSEFWQTLIQVREAVNKALEEKRNEGLIGAGLEAEIHLAVTKPLYENLSLLKDELRFVLITSKAEIQCVNAQPKGYELTALPNLWLKVMASEYPKCQRCWHHREDVFESGEYEGLCGRCVLNVSEGNGEERRYA